MGELRLIDGFGRVHSDLRVSLTDRCSLRCTYCMPAEGLPWLPGAQMLTTDELLRIVAVAVDAGVETVRLTGGEPLLRPDVVTVVAGIAALGVDVSMTTNGLRLPGLAAPLHDAGLTRVNISLDTLDRQTFRDLTHRDRLVETLAGIRAAQIAGLQPVKINTVLLRGINDHEAPDLLRWAISEGVHLRFIEQMPLDPQHGWRRDEMVTAAGDHGFAGGGRLPADPDRRSGAGAGPTLGRERGTRAGGPRGVRHAPLLRDLQPPAPDRGRPVAQLPVRPRGDGPAHTACVPAPTTKSSCDSWPRVWRTSFRATGSTIPRSCSRHVRCRRSGASAVATIRFFAAAREAAGRSSAEVSAGPIGRRLAELDLGPGFDEVLSVSTLLSDGSRLEPRRVRSR